jgi:uncharacterized protein (TIGR04255 family)
MPPIPKNLPETFTNFFMQINVPYKAPSHHVILTQTIEPAIESKLPFILDIDVIEVGKISREELTQKFNILRSIKNETFENCITDLTRNLFL